MSHLFIHKTIHLYYKNHLITNKKMLTNYTSKNKLFQRWPPLSVGLSYFTEPVKWPCSMLNMFFGIFWVSFTLCMHFNSNSMQIMHIDSSTNLFFFLMLGCQSLMLEKEEEFDNNWMTSEKNNIELINIVV